MVDGMYFAFVLISRARSFHCGCFITRQYIIITLKSNCASQARDTLPVLLCLTLITEAKKKRLFSTLVGRGQKVFKPRYLTCQVFNWACLFIIFIFPVRRCPICVFNFSQLFQFFLPLVIFLSKRYCWFDICLGQASSDEGQVRWMC